MRGLADDLRHSWRSLRASPRFAIGLEMVVAGIGASLAISPPYEAMDNSSSGDRRCQ